MTVCEHRVSIGTRCVQCFEAYVRGLKAAARHMIAERIAPMQDTELSRLDELDGVGHALANVDPEGVTK